MHNDGIANNCALTNFYATEQDGIFYHAFNNATIRNNYIRQSANGFTFESSSSQYIKNMGTYTAVGNLMENCGQGIRISLASERLKWVFDEIILQHQRRTDIEKRLRYVFTHRR